MLSDFNHIFILIFFASLLLLAHLNDIKVKNFTLKAICIFLISLSLLFLLSNECFKGIENAVEDFNDVETCLPRIFVECKSFIVSKDPVQPRITICKNIITNKKIYEYVQD
ncbi:hypothetical protein [Nostoc sp.]|uniref:hypothetical protein n=1 Tax=Nostoc sp. TaxID=1180 RepID=UPI002FF9BC00